MKNIFRKIFVIGLWLFVSANAFSKGAPKRDIYEIRIYSMKNDQQINAVDMYLQSAFIPAMHRFGIKKIGVFKLIANDTAVIKKMLVLVPYTSVEQWKKISEQLLSDVQLQSASGSFRNAPAESAPYLRMESIITEAFPMHPNLTLPVLNAPKNERVYELRSYESPTEHLFERKVNMFNQGDEIGLFKRLNFNAIFYSSVIAGSKMPNLMYMITFENMADHDAHWKQFGNDPQWKKISTMPEYENKVNVSHIDAILMHPTDYSDI